MLKLYFILVECFNLALRYFTTNRTRSILTLLSISLGIFSITTVFLVVHSIQNNIRQSIESLGAHVLYVQKWSWSFASDYPWWKYIQRPLPTYENYISVKKFSHTARYVAFTASSRQTVQSTRKKLNNISLLGVTDHYKEIQSLEVQKGRYFTQAEMNNGSKVALLGSAVFRQLFRDEHISEEMYINVLNQRIKVIGVLREEGQQSVTFSHDNVVLLPFMLYRQLIDVNSEYNNTTAIIVKLHDYVSMDYAKDELRGILRASRKLRPDREDDFSLNEASLLTTGFQNLFSIITIAGWLIGGFGLLVGGFGIANIMFVSVTERTSTIGLQKAIGAQPVFILLQYLFESVILSLTGGMLGLMLVFILLIVLHFAAGFSFSLNVQIIVFALNIAIITGVLSGILPALRASRLDPISAIRKN